MLELIGNRIGLTESVECLEIGLIYSYMYKTISTKELAKKMKVPVPIATAFKKELVKYGWMKRESFYFLTPVGREYVQYKLNYKNVDIQTYQELLVENSKRMAYLEKIANSLNPIIEKRPVAKRELDQAHATRETVIKRVSLLIEDPLIFSRKIAFVGDDDLVSLFLSRTLEWLGVKKSLNIFVYDIDPEILDFINDHGSRQVKIQTFEQDVKIREKITYEQVDVVFTDPPYTPEGILTFVRFGESLLMNHGKMYVSFNHKTPGIQGFIQKEFNERGFNFTGIMTDFNHYLGGSIIGNVSNLYVLQKNNMSQTMYASESIYTKSLKKKQIVNV